MATTRPTAHHVGVTVTDLERTVEFYRDALGLDVVDRFEVAGESFASAVAVEGASARFVHLDGGDVRIELVSSERVGDDRDESGLDQPGAAPVGRSVEDVDAHLASFPDDADAPSEPGRPRRATDWRSSGARREIPWRCGRRRRPGPVRALAGSVALTATA